MMMFSPETTWQLARDRQQRFRDRTNWRNGDHDRRGAIATSARHR